MKKYYKNPYITLHKFNNKYLLHHQLSQEVIYGNETLNTLWNTIDNDKMDESTCSKHINLLHKNNFISINNYNNDTKIQNHLKSWIETPVDIFQLYLIINRECNLRCKYCRQFLKKCNKKNDFMDEKLAFEIVKKFLKTPSKRKKGIVFYGGEPMLSQNILLKLINYVRNYKDENTEGKTIELNLFTNGIVINKETAKKIAKNNVFVIISYDGLPSQNDKMRVFQNQEGSSKKVLKGIKTYIDAGCKTGISMTIGSHNFDNIPLALEHIQSLNAINLGFNLPHDDINNPLRPKNSKTDWLDDICSYFWDATKKGLYVEHILRKLRLFVNKTIKISECPAVDGRIVALPDGQIGLCEGAIGYDQFFTNTDNWVDLNKDITSWKKSIPLMDNKCKNCFALGICGGGCMLDGYFEYKKLSNFDTVRCNFSKKILIRILQEAIKNQNSDCEVLTDANRKKLWNEMVKNHENKPLSTSANFGEIKYAFLEQ